MYVRFPYLKKIGVIPNRVQLTRAMDSYGFPQPYQFGPNTLAWKLDEVEAWVSSCKRTTPKSPEPETVARTSPELVGGLDKGNVQNE